LQFDSLRRSDFVHYLIGCLYETFVDFAFRVSIFELLWFKRLPGELASLIVRGIL
jgi:hypothetical protein